MANLRNVVMTRLAAAFPQFCNRKKKVSDLSSFMSQRTFQNINSAGQDLLLELLVPRQEVSAAVEAAHSVPFLDQPARLNKNRAPLFSATAFQSGLGEVPPTHGVSYWEKC